MNAMTSIGKYIKRTEALYAPFRHRKLTRKRPFPSLRTINTWPDLIEYYNQPQTGLYVRNIFDKNCFNSFEISINGIQIIPATRDPINSMVVSGSNIGSDGSTLVTNHASKGMNTRDNVTMSI